MNKLDSAIVTLLGIFYAEKLDTDPHIQTKWANSRYWVKRALAADSQLLTTQQIDKLLTENNPTILTRLAWNENITPEQAERLSEWVRKMYENKERTEEDQHNMETIAYALSHANSTKISLATEELCREIGVIK